MDRRQVHDRVMWRLGGDQSNRDSRILEVDRESTSTSGTLVYAQCQGTVHGVV